MEKGTSSYLHRILGCRRRWPLDLTSSLKREKMRTEVLFIATVPAELFTFQLCIQMIVRQEFPWCFKGMCFMWRLSYSRFKFYFWFQRLYVTCLSSLTTQRTSLSILDFVGLLEDVCLSSGYYSQERLWTCWAGDKNDTEKLFISAYFWRLWAPPSSQQSTMLHSYARIRIWRLWTSKRNFSATQNVI